MSYSAGFSLITPIFAFALSPLMVGIINRTKAAWAGRQGPPILQPYYDLAKLTEKSAVYSKTVSWVFLAGPIAGFSAMAVAAILMPFGGLPSPLAFEGDIVLLAYLMGLARLVTILAAMDTGSAFEGMGASREAFYSALAEIVFFLALCALTWQTGSISMSGILNFDGPLNGPSTALLSAALFVAALAENARIPVDDPNTHLELTMIHEVMVLDHSGPDFALIQYGQAIKLWIFSALLTQILTPHGGGTLLTLIYNINMMLAIAIFIGTVESTMARLRLVNVPQFLIGAAALSALSVILLLR
ncbi:MAG: NADH-quinone oxidoreductase subunit H [Nitrospinae bacterium]|nr:NADH-quinone oxidoreductase subunit H [Nitrospinota bacterium]